MKFFLVKLQVRSILFVVMQVLYFWFKFLYYCSVFCEVRVDIFSVLVKTDLFFILWYCFVTIYRQTFAVLYVLNFEQKFIFAEHVPQLTL